MEKKELLELQRKLERKFEQRKLKRVAYTVLFYTAVLFGICCLQDRLVGATLWDALGELLFCFIISCICFVVNAVIFHQLFTINQGEKETLDFLKRRIEVKEKEDK